MLLRAGHVDIMLPPWTTLRCVLINLAEEEQGVPHACYKNRTRPNSSVVNTEKTPTVLRMHSEKMDVLSPDQKPLPSFSTGHQGSTANVSFKRSDVLSSTLSLLFLVAKKTKMVTEKN